MTVSYSIYRLLSTYFLPINSVCNTIVYFVRIRDLRLYTVRLLQRLKFACVSGSTTRVIANTVAMTSGSNETSHGNKACWSETSRNSARFHAGAAHFVFVRCDLHFSSK